MCGIVHRSRFEISLITSQLWVSTILAVGSSRVVHEIRQPFMYTLSIHSLYIIRIIFLNCSPEQTMANHIWPYSQFVWRDTAAASSFTLRFISKMSTTDTSLGRLRAFVAGLAASTLLLPAKHAGVSVCWLCVCVCRRFMSAGKGYSKNGILLHATHHHHHHHPRARRWDQLLNRYFARTRLKHI